MSGTAPSAALLARARGGQIGGVILHGENFRSSAGLRAITASLQRAAAAGGQPPLLIAVDQEGGPVKTVPWIPPTWSPAQLGRAESDGAALAQGQKTGAALRALGINTDFAPVVDVPASPASFLYRQGRTWSFDAHTTARLAGWFAAGLGDGGAVATAKHFPGLGLSSRNTDRFVARIRTTKAALAPGLRPYRTAIAQGVPLIMLSNAVYTAYDPSNAAGWSAAITKLLRRTLGFRGVTITDSLDAAGHARHVGPAPLAIRASNAGTDLLLLTASESGSRGVYQALLSGSRRLDRTQLLASYRRIVALKRRLQP
jgi:beta-N-acetylhexosaminidase